MTAQEVKDYILTQLVVPVNLVSKVINALNKIVDYISTSVAADIIPDWTSALTFNTTGAGAGKYCKYPDTSGKKRLFETKTESNINNAPPTNPSITENTYWQEVSPSASAAIPEWAAGVYGAGLIIVYHNHGVDGKGLYVLLDPTRPYASTNIETEIIQGDWEKISGSGGGSADFVYKETPTGLVNGSNVTYTLSQTPAVGSEHVFKNGQLISSYTISDNILTFATAPETGDELRISFEIPGEVGAGGSGVTREFDRDWSAELLFDKNEIDYEEHTLDEEITYTVADGGHLINQFSTAVQRITTDGTFAINFLGYQFIANIQSGDILPAGTYQLFFFYRNGIASVSLMLPTSEEATLITLGIPGSFAAVPGGDPDSEVDLSWAIVSSASSYHIDFSSTSSGPWTSLADPASGATAYTHTGLDEGTQYFYRVRAIGDGITYANSPYAAANATTEDAGDSTPPTFVFSPANAATDIAVNAVAVITASEPLRLNGGGEVTNASLSSILTVKVGNISGADIPYTPVINAGKTEITITPNIVWPALDNVFIRINGVEDVNGNDATVASATFATSDFTKMLGNYSDFGEVLDTLFSANDTNFDLLVTAKDLFVAGDVHVFRKYETGQRTFTYRFFAGNAIVKIYEPTTPDHTADTREIIWTGAVADDDEHTYELRYRGAVDTNNGLDRFSLYIDGVLQGSKSLVVAGAHPWPWSLRETTSHLKVGPTHAQVKDIKVKSTLGTVTELDVPIIRTGIDVSGNNRHGTWL